jgi:hypothetical protein
MEQDPMLKREWRCPLALLTLRTTCEYPLGKREISRGMCKSSIDSFLVSGHSLLTLAFEPFDPCGAKIAHSYSAYGANFRIQDSAALSKDRRTGHSLYSPNIWPQSLFPRPLVCITRAKGRLIGPFDAQRPAFKRDS